MIVMLCGESGTGKSTVAEILADYYDANVVSLADPLKEFCKEVFDWPEDALWGPSEMRNYPDSRGVSPRKALQTLGTDWGRALYEDIWIDYGLRRARGSDKLVVIPDGRFANEARKVREMGGKVVRLSSTINMDTPSHESELLLIPQELITDRLENDKSKGREVLKLAVLDMARSWFPEDDSVEVPF